MTTDTAHVIIVYEPEQCDDAAAYARRTGARIAVMDRWAEEAFTRRAVEFESLAKFVPAGRMRDTLFDRAASIARDWYRVPAMAFFTHHGVRIGEALEVNVDDFAEYALYSEHIISRFLMENPQISRVAVFHSYRAHRLVSDDSAPYLPFFYSMPVSVVNLRSRVQGYEAVVLGEAVGTVGIGLLPRVRLWQRLVLMMVAAAMSLVPRKRLRILGSEDWSQVASVFDYLPEAELVLTDRQELRKMSLRALIRNRIRIVLLSLLASARIRRSAHKTVEAFTASWAEAWPLVAREIDAVAPHMSSLFEPLLLFLVCTYSERVVSDIECAHSLIGRERWDLLLLRASVSAQHHFFVLAHVARAHGVPSIEVQHAGAVYDPRCVHARLEADHLAAFGPSTCEEYAARYPTERLHAIGSPRFERYLERPLQNDERVGRLRALGLDPTRPVVLVVVPKEGSPLTLAAWHPTSYDVGEMIEALAQTRSGLTDIQFIFKFRKKGCAPWHNASIRERFGAAAIVSEANLDDMIRLSDIVVTAMSSAIYEAILAQKPIVLFPWKEDAYHDRIYEHAAPLAYDRHELTTIMRQLCADPAERAAQIQRQSRFIAERYSFTRGAARRTAALIRDIARDGGKESPHGQSRTNIKE